MTKVSIITVSLNCRDGIERTIRSVLGQDCPDLEYIVIDSHSTDGTRDVLRRYHHRIATCISETDGGIYPAMNKGLALAHGEVVAFLNAGDVYAGETVVSEAVRAIQSRELDAVYGDLAYVAAKRPDKVVRYWRAGDFHPGAFRYGWVPPHPTFFCRREVYERFGGFNETYRIAGDFELMLRLFEKHRIRVGYLAKLLVFMQTGGKANTWGGILRGNMEVVHALRHHGVEVPLAYYWRKPLWKVSQISEVPRLDPNKSLAGRRMPCSQLHPSDCARSSTT